MSKTLKINKILKINMLILFIMLPIVDCLRTTNIKNIEFCNIAFIELINIFLIGFSLILTIFKIKKKELIPLILYTLVLAIYLIFHSINILHFNLDIFLNAKPNIITEIYYLLRVYYLPVLLLFILYKNRDIFNYAFYQKIIKLLIIEISGSIIILNILKFSYASYGENTFINYNIFDFFKANNISFQLLSTRGWFDSANELSAILLMILPINIYILYKENKLSNYFLYIIQVLSMIIIGTKTSALGAILISLCAIFINLFIWIFKKEKIKYQFIILAIITSLYLFISPFGFYIFKEKSEVSFKQYDEYHNNLLTLSEEEEMANYIENHLYDFRINEMFIQLYPIRNDISFWKNIALGNRFDNNNSRIMKIKIIKRVKERNQNQLDSYLGMGYTINFMDLERDYVYQYYLFGIIGLIVILIIQFISLLLSIKNILINFKKINLNDSLLLLMSPVLGFIIAYLSGHVFGWVSPMIILTLSLCILNNYLMEERK